MNWYIRFILLVVFIGAVLIIVVLQFNSGRSISSLIGSNQKMLSDFDVKADLNELKGNIVVLESKVRGLIISGHVGNTEYLEFELDKVSKAIKQLDKSRFDASVYPSLDVLRRLVNEKIKFNQQILDTFRFRGKVPAEKIINAGKGFIIADSIFAVVEKINEIHRHRLTGLIDAADADGRKAKNMGTLMAIIAILASVFTFSYALLKVSQQQKLIEMLNISEQKALKAGQAKENFLSNMSHEIRTPLNAILGFTNLLSKKKLDRESETYVATIYNAGENLMAIINDVLDSSKLEAGTMRIENVSFSINDVVNSVASMFGQKADGSILQFKVEIDTGLPMVLSGDPVRLTQILVNILSNSFKFTKSGVIFLKVRTVSEEEDKTVVSFTVSDTGIGIEADKVERVFERFQQAEDSVTRKYGGTGLGLSIVKELVELQNGTITVQSIPGVGTDFSFVIPYYNYKELHVARGVQTAQIADNKLAGVNVLVVEDNKVNQALLKHIFSRWGLSGKFVANGKEALAELENNTYQCILMDIQMPEMDGYTTSRQIRKDLQLRTPVIAMTAHAMAGEREKCIRSGMNDYISKPIDENVLYELIIQYTSQTPLSQPAGRQINAENKFQVIDLGYMNSIAQGDIGYKKLATRLFLEAVPEELNGMREKLLKGHLDDFRFLVHNFKTTVSVMGLDKFIGPLLDLLENQSSPTQDLPALFEEVTNYSHLALAEARELSLLLEVAET